MFDKTKDLYVKACVIQNNVTDSQGDTLNSKEIKQIFTSFNNQDSFEVNHDGIPIEGVTLLENYISTADETIGATTVPSGSWNVVMKVTCPKIQEQILDNTFGGVSLSNRVKSECNCKLTGQIRYEDLESAECVMPLYISLVDEGANGVGLTVFDYEGYIQKSKRGSAKMNLIDELKSLIQKAETEPIINKSSEEQEETVDDEEHVDEPIINKSSEEETDEESAEEEKEEEPVVEKECKEDEEATVEKSEESNVEDLIKRIEALEEIVKTLTEKSEKSEEQVKEEQENEEPKEPVITKSAKVVVTEEPVTAQDFYTLTGRDPLTGKKL